MNPIVLGASTVVAIASIGSGALALDRMHTSSADFEEYVERQYIRDLKREIREVQSMLEDDPGQEFLQDALVELVDELCDLKPTDRLCEEIGQ